MPLGRTLIILGLVLVAGGGGVALAGRAPLPVERRRGGAYCDYASWSNADYFGAGAGGGGRGGDTGRPVAHSVRQAAGRHTDSGEEFELLLPAHHVPDRERGGEPGDVAAAAVNLARASATQARTTPRRGGRASRRLGKCHWLRRGGRGARRRGSRRAGCTFRSEEHTSELQ